MNRFKALALIAMVMLLVGFSTTPGIAESERAAQTPVPIKDQPKWGYLWGIIHESFKNHTPPLNPSCAIIFIGLTKDESVSFQRTFDSIGKEMQFRKVAKDFSTYSGGPLANYITDHIGFFVRSSPTSEIKSQRDWECSFRTDSGDHTNVPSSFDFNTAISSWTTNSSLILDGGTKTWAPYTGCIRMLVYDNQYTAKAFRDVVSSLEREIRKQWTNRSVEVFVSDGSIK